MTLKTILAAKGSEVLSIDFTADLTAAAKLLTKHRIGALVVLGADGRLGPLSGVRRTWPIAAISLCGRYWG